MTGHVELDSHLFSNYDQLFHIMVKYNSLFMVSTIAAAYLINCYEADPQKSTFITLEGTQEKFRAREILKV